VDYKPIKIRIYFLATIWVKRFTKSKSGGYMMSEEEKQMKDCAATGN
jgi:hypothetical protein